MAFLYSLSIVGQAQLLFSHAWTITGISLIFLHVTVYLHLHSTLNAQIVSLNFQLDSNLFAKNIFTQQQSINEVPF